jgi:hypothetical protein
MSWLLSYWRNPIVMLIAGLFSGLVGASIEYPLF